jgi:carotenoid cleavage dioxygenase-like enzyme
LTRVRNSIEPLDFNPETSAVATRSSDTWREQNFSREYLRTPLFLSNKYPKGEDDGLLICWSYSLEEGQSFGAHLLLFTPDLDTVKKIAIPGNNRIPYSVHSSVFTREDDSKDKIYDLYKERVYI